MANSEAHARGPVEHERRDQIVAAAYKHFRHYGYNKTTVADLAKDIGLSTAYIYKFFDSKKAIGEAVCTRCLGEISDTIDSIAAEKRPASERLRRIFIELARQGARLFFQDRKMHDIVSAAIAENWQSGHTHDASLIAAIRRIVQDGRETGEFERKTALDETCRAIFLAISAIKHPIILEQRLDSLDEDSNAIASLVLRSVAAW